jgi:uncharacterized protein YjbJ (UPF0337 family)
MYGFGSQREVRESARPGVGKPDPRGFASRCTQGLPFSDPALPRDTTIREEVRERAGAAPGAFPAREDPCRKEANVNWDQVEGNWRQLRGKVREKWGELTDDDLDQIAGRRDQLVGKIQERLGYARERAEREVDELARTW